MLNRLGGEVFNTRDPTPRRVTMPALDLPPLDSAAIEAEARAAQARVHVIRQGRDALEAITRSASFESYLAIGLALVVGKNHALRVSGARQAWGQHYSREFSEWMKRHGFAGMQKSLRSASIELAENAEEITAWRSTLPEKQRRRLSGPLANVRRYKASLTHGNSKCPQDLKREAASAWRRFRSCLEGLPKAEAQPIWATVLAEAQALCR
jgi:hypothetical protein